MSGAAQVIAGYTAIIAITLTAVAYGVVSGVRQSRQERASRERGEP